MNAIRDVGVLSRMVRHSAVLSRSRVCMCERAQVALTSPCVCGVTHRVTGSHACGNHLSFTTVPVAAVAAASPFATKAATVSGAAREFDSSSGRTQSFVFETAVEYHPGPRKVCVRVGGGRVSAAQTHSHLCGGGV